MKLLFSILIILFYVYAFSQDKIKTCSVNSDCYIQSEAKLGGKRIIPIKSGTDVDVIGISNTFYKVKYGEIIGFINVGYIPDQDLESRIASKSNLLSGKKKSLEELQKEYSKRDALCIFNNTLQIGMSQKAAYEILGKPSKINRTVTAYEITEQCIYDYGNYNYKYLYFKNEVLQVIQE